MKYPLMLGDAVAFNTVVPIGVLTCCVIVVGNHDTEVAAEPIVNDIAALVVEAI